MDYVGSRYVPKFMGTYDATQNYEVLCVVDNGLGTSYISKIPTPAGTPLTDTNYWAVYGATSGAIINLQNQIDGINLEITDINDDIDNLESKALKGRKLNCNMILNDLHASTDGYAQGSCYIGNNRIVSYLALGDNTGTLRCYNINSFTVIWEHVVAAYHGNSICYNPNNNHIYICAALDDSTSQATNHICEIDLSDPSTILNDIVLPDITAPFSLVYDRDANVFYANTTSDALIYKYNAALTSLIETITIDSDFYNFMQFGDAQGLGDVVDGRFYLINSNDRAYSILCIDAATGDGIAVYDLPDIINECRVLGEPEAVMYDFDNDKLLFASSVSGSGCHEHVINMFVETDMFSDILISYPVPTHNNGGYHSHRDAYLICVNGANPLRPTWNIDKNIVPTVNDALMYAKIHGDAIRVKMRTAQSGLTQVTNKISNLQYAGCNVRLEGESDSDHIEVIKLNITDFCAMSFLFCDFDAWDSGSYHYNVSVGQNAKVYFQKCIFKDLGSSGYMYHVVAGTGADVRLYQCTYQGTPTADTDSYECGSIVKQP